MLYRALYTFKIRLIAIDCLSNKRVPIVHRYECVHVHTCIEKGCFRVVMRVEYVRKTLVITRTEEASSEK